MGGLGDSIAVTQLCIGELFPPGFQSIPGLFLAPGATTRISGTPLFGVDQPYYLQLSGSPSVFPTSTGPFLKAVNASGSGDVSIGIIAQGGAGGQGNVVLANNQGTLFVASSPSGAGTIVNFLTVNGAPTGSLPGFAATGTDANIGTVYQTKGTGTHRFQTRWDTGSVTQFEIIDVASAVNNLRVQGAVTGGNPSFTVVGPDATISINMNVKGVAGTVGLATGNANFLQVMGSATAGIPNLLAVGTDPNIPLQLGGKGTWGVLIGNQIGNAANVTYQLGLRTPVIATATRETVGGRFQAYIGATSAPSGSSPLSTMDVDLFLDATNTQNWTAPQLVALNAYTGTTAGATGTISQLFAFQVSGALAATGVTISDWRGIYVQQPTNAGTVTAAFGIRIQQPTIGTTNYPLYVEGGTSFFGGPVVFKGKPWNDVRAYGAVADGVTDDTTSIQTAITAASTNGGIVFFPAGTYIVSSLNLTVLSSIVLQGSGISNTILRTNSNLLTTNVIDMTGAQTCTIRDLSIQTGTNTPGTGVLLSSTLARNGNNLTLQNVSITGKFAFAGLYIYGAVSSRIISSQVTNSNTAAGVNAATTTFSTVNTAGVVSAFATIVTGAQTTSDWNLFDAESHDQTAVTTLPSVLFDGAPVDIVWVGGNISNNDTAASTQLVKFTGAVARIVFQRVTFYNEVGGVGICGSCLLVSAAVNVSDVHLVNCNTQATSSVFGAAAGATLTRPVFLGSAPSGGATNIFGNGNNATLVDGFANLAGQQINVGAGGTITRGVYFNESGITPAADGSAMWTDSTGALRLGGKLNPGGTRTTQAAVTVGASPFIYTNNDGSLETVYIQGGAVTDISIIRNSVTTSLFGGTPATVVLSPGDGVQITYTTAPTMIKVLV